MDVEAAARRWIDGWLRAWPSEDVDGIASTYTADALYSSHPFRAPETARSYLARAFGEERLVKAWFGDPVAAGERAAVEYWAVLRSAQGSEVTIAGAAFLHFDDEGQVAEHRDYWDQVDGERLPPAGWGR